MAVVTRYVNTASAGGDGTTNAESGANAAYASLNAWEAAEQTDLDTANNIHVVHLSTGSGVAADATATTLTGWTTSAADYLVIQQDDDHAGVWDSTKYRLEADGGTTGILTVGVEFLRIIGMQISNTAGAPSGNSSAVIQEGSYTITDLRMNNNIFKGGRYTVRIANGTTTNGYYWNNIIYGGSAGGLLLASGGTQYVYSSTILVNLYQSTGTVNAKNVYATTYIGTITKTTCASSDTTGSASLQNIATSTSSGAYFTNVTAGSEDFHIKTSSALKDVGTDTSADAAPLNFTDDIDGDTRSGTWDIGADEFVAAGGSTIPIFMKSYRDRRMGALL